MNQKVGKILKKIWKKDSVGRTLFNEIFYHDPNTFDPIDDIRLRIPLLILFFIGIMFMMSP